MSERKVDLDQLQRLLNMGLNKSEIARRLGVAQSTISRAVEKLRTVAPKVVTLEKGMAFAESQFNVMENCLRDLRKLEEILDPVHRYNLGDRADFIALQRKIEDRRESRVETFDFSGDPRLIECRILEVKDKCRAFILAAWKSVADKDEVEAHRKALIETLREMDPHAAQRFVDRLRQRRLVRHNVILS
jgi:transcriptional regulator with XRE-family HTH domain